MCLTTLTKTDKTITEGYKCFERGGSWGQNLDCIFTNTKELQINQWLEARQVLLSLDPEDFKSEEYMSGFHFFETLHDARIYASVGYNCKIVIKKILVQDITASGTQSTCFITVTEIKNIDIPCHVAFKMLILPGDYQTCFTEPEVVLPRRR
jgi:hypothetical protein